MEDTPDLGYICDGFGRVKGMLAACNEVWQKAWNLGDIAVADETMW